MGKIISVIAMMPWYVSVFLASCGAIAGDYMGKLWSVNHKNSFFLLAIFGYLWSGFFYLPALLKKGLVISSVIWSVVYIIGFLVIGLLIFKEPLNVRQIIGIVFGVAAVLLLSF